MSALPYVQQLSKVIVAQITQTIGWNSIQTTPLELLTDILHKYLEELTRQTQRYTELYGRTEPNLDDVALAFSDLNINISDLEDYISNVDPVPCIINVPKFPIPKESNLNFLKPGSKEVVTRPVHVHEHLPPIFPHEESPLPPREESTSTEASNHGRIENSTNIIQTYISTNQICEKESLDENGVFHNDTLSEYNIIAETTVIENQSSGQDDENTFKKPVPPSNGLQSVKPLNSANESNDKNLIGKPTREIVSCIMTTSGFISPAREGKLPEAKRPAIIVEDEPEPIEIEIKQRTPSPIPVVEKKHHSNKRERENKYDNHHNDGEMVNPSNVEPNDNDGKLYEVVKSVPQYPEQSVKKKTKKSLLDAARAREQKKQKKSKLLQDNQLPIKHPKDEGLKVSSANSAFGIDSTSYPMADDGFGSFGLPAANDKMKRKIQKLESLKKKHKKNRDLAAMAYLPNEQTDTQTKQKKKRISKLTKKNLTEMGLNPNAIEGFSIPYMDDSQNLSSHDRSDFSSNFLHNEMKLDEMSHPKEKKVKQSQKLSNEPDKQKIKFFKKLTSASSSSHNKSADDMMNRSNLSQTSHLTNSTTSLNVNDSYDMQQWPDKQLNADGSDKFMPPVNLEDLSPSKKSKLLKKLNKTTKEPKIPKIKKVKKEFPSKKQRPLKTMDAAMPKPAMMNDMLPFGGSASQTNPLFLPNMGLLESINAPGLLPLNPLFQSVRFDLAPQNQIPNYPFPGLQGFDFANFQRYKRPNYNDGTQNDSAVTSSKNTNADDSVNSPPKPLCNVAPLMPPSLLPMEMSGSNQNRSFMTNQPMDQSPLFNESHQELDGFSFNSKKSQPGQASGLASSTSQSFNNDKNKSFGSPIVIDSEDDDKYQQRSDPTHSADQDSQEDLFSGQIKHKKIKDKSSSGKKEKKDREIGGIKMKKKKDKKDKSKNKSEKHANRDGDYPKLPKDKAVLKKEKREKKKEKEKERLVASANESNEMAGGSSLSDISYGAQMHSEWSRDVFNKDQSFGRTDLNEIASDVSNVETNAIPKLTLKLAPSSPTHTSRPTTPDFQLAKKSSKKKKKQWRAMEEDSDKSPSEFDANISASSKITDPGDQVKREPSPELARISALITRPPKQKSSNKQQNVEFNPTINTQRSEYFDAHFSTSQPSTPSSRGRPKGSTGALKSGKKSSKASTSFVDNENDVKSHTTDNPSPVLDIQTNILHTVDEQTNEENQVWICPACGRVDDGTPMIGCDGCDAWYHWVCVGIQVPPDQDQDWFCRVCILKKQEDKKKKRKKKDKKDH